MNFVENGTYNVRELIEIPVPLFHGQPDFQNLELVFDDGTCKSTMRELVLCRILWRLYKCFPMFKVSKEHHYRALRGKYDGNSDGDILNKILWDAVDLCRENGLVVDKQEACEVMYDITDDLFEFYRNIPQTVMSIDITDFIAVQTHPDVWNAMQKLQDNPYPVKDDIVDIYDTVAKTLYSPSKLTALPVVFAAKCSAIKVSQFNKIVGPYGFITDVDSYILPHPVRDSLTAGLTKIEDMAMESRTAAMSIYYQSGAMQDSEYLTRQLQSEVASVWTVYEGDCGSRDYLPFPVAEDVGVRDLIGKWYLDEETGVEKPIRKNDRRLRGKVLKLRSPIKCKLPTRTGVCERCYGEMYDSLVPTDNVGHVAATQVQKKQTQRILSNKHLVGSASADAFVIGGSDLDYLITKKDQSEIYLSPKLKGLEVRMIFSESEATKLEEIKYIDDLLSTSASRLSSLNSVKFQIIKNDMVVREHLLTTSVSNRRSFLTTDMLLYLKEHGWNVTPDGSCVIDLTNWDHKVAVMDMPMIQYSTPAHMQAVKKFLTSGPTAGKESITTYPTPTAGLLALHELVSSKLDVNFVHLEIIVLSLLIESAENSDYRIPLDKTKGKIGSYEDIMSRRDIALAMSYEAHFGSVFERVDTYIIEHRHPHPFNNLLSG